MKKISFPHILSFLIIFAMLATTLMSCAGGGDNKIETDTTTTSDGPPGETDKLLDNYGREIIDPDIPDNLDFGGRDFVVHTRGNVEQYEWKADFPNGEILNDTIYERNMLVEELLNIKIVVLAEGTWADYSTVTLPKMKASIMSGDYAYDLIAGFSTPIATLATTGLILNLNDVPYLDFDKPWWSQNIVEELTIDDILHFAVGSLSLSMIYSMECIFVNTDMLKDVAPGYNIYDTVKSGNWTWDEMQRLSASAYFDNNGNGVKDEGDRYGMAFCDNSNTIHGFLYSTGNKLILRDAEGYPKINIETEKLSEIVDKLIVLLYETDSAYPADKTPLDFSDGNVMFFNHWLYWGQTQYSHLMETYGIVPMPKYNTQQENYYTPVQSGMHMYCIPIDVKNVEENGIITEALAAQSYRTLQPAYYEIVLKTKYAKDSDTSQMVDIMYDTVFFDFAQIFNTDLGILNNISDVVRSKNNTLVSILKATSSIYEKKLEALIKGIIGQT